MGHICPEIDNPSEEGLYFLIHLNLVDIVTFKTYYNHLCVLHAHPCLDLPKETYDTNLLQNLSFSIIQISAKEATINAKKTEQKCNAAVKVINRENRRQGQVQELETDDDKVVSVTMKVL